MRLPTVVVAAVLGLCVVFAGVAVAASFTDPTGDVLVLPEGSTLTGLDMTAVEVTNTPDGLLTLRVTLAGAPPALPGPLSLVAFFIDADKNAATGDEGLDALVAHGVDDTGSAAILALWDDAVGDYVERPTTALTTSYLNGVVELTLPRSELLDTRGFTFGVTSVVVGANDSVALDVVPDADELLTYDLVGIPPQVPPRLTATSPVGSPAHPRAGKRFAVTSLVTRADTGLLVSAGSVGCSVHVGAGKVRASGKLGVAGARCTLTVPKNAKGKVLRGTMTIRALGSTTKRAFNFRVG